MAKGNARCHVDTSRLLAEAIPYNAEKALIDLSPYNGKQYRILLRKDGDSETGGYSETFDLE